MKILYHHRTQAEDAQGIHIGEMVNAFGSLGHVVHVASVIAPSERKKGEKRFYSGLTNLLPNWLYDSMSLGYNLIGYRHLIKTINHFRPDVIYERYSLNNFCGIWASRRYNLPLLLEVNAPLYMEQLQLGRLGFRKLAQFSERWICSNSTKTIVVSHVMKTLLEGEGIPALHMVVMHNGIDPKLFNPAISGAAIRKKFDIKDDELVLGFVGWFRKWHGLDLLLEIVHEAGLKGRGVKVLLVGDGPAYRELHDYAEKNNLLDTVIFTRAIDRDAVASYIAAMDVTVQPSATEYACPMKIIEYMAMGKCILAPKQPNITEILDDGVTGFLFQSGQKESMRSTLLRVLDSPKERREAGERAHGIIVEREFFWQANARRSLELI
jgi:glycosyltransferase involved in cell wall biosynthesis